MEQQCSVTHFFQYNLNLPVIFGGWELVTALRNNGYHDTGTIQNLLSQGIILTMREDLRESSFNPACNYFLVVQRGDEINWGTIGRLAPPR